MNIIRPAITHRPISIAQFAMSGIFFGLADGLFGAADIGHDEICGERVQSALDTFDRCEKRLQVNGNVCSFAFFCHVCEWLLLAAKVLEFPYLCNSNYPQEKQYDTEGISQY